MMIVKQEKEASTVEKKKENENLYTWRSMDTNK